MDAAKITSHLTAVSLALSGQDPAALLNVCEILIPYKRANSVWLIGNGGSAANASHFAVDLRKRANIRAIALPDLTPTITAYGNDDGWGAMYSHPLGFFMQPGDLLIAISCSGRSANIIEAANQAGKNRLVVFTGPPDRYNILAATPSRGVVYANVPDIRAQEDMHLAFFHAIAGALDDAQL